MNMTDKESGQNIQFLILPSTIAVADKSCFERENCGKKEQGQNEDTLDGQSAEIVGRERSERTGSGTNTEGQEPRVVEQHDRQSQTKWHLERERERETKEHTFTAII